MDGTTTQADAKLGTENAGTPTYTKDQVDKMLRDARTAAMADVGRMKTEAEKALKAASAAADRLKQLEKEREEVELEAAKDEPDRLTMIRTRQQMRQREAELAQAREELNATKTTLTELQSQRAESQKEINAREIAARLGVDLSRLVKLAKFTDGSAEAIEDLAKDLTKNQDFHPDSNRGNGGNTRSALEIRKDFIAGKYSNNPEKYEQDLKAVGARP